MTEFNSMKEQFPTLVFLTEIDEEKGYGGYVNQDCNTIKTSWDILDKSVIDKQRIRIAFDKVIKSFPASELRYIVGKEFLEELGL